MFWFFKVYFPMAIELAVDSKILILLEKDCILLVPTKFFLRQRSAFLAF